MAHGIVNGIQIADARFKLINLFIMFNGVSGILDLAL